MLKRKKSRLTKTNKGLLFTSLLLTATGLIVLSSASVVLSYQRFGYNTYYLTRQASLVLVGLVLMYIFSRIDYHILKRYSVLLYLLGLGLLLVVLIPSIGFQVGNSRRWIDFGFTVFQPSEFAKLALVIYLSAWFDLRQDRLHSFLSGLLPAVLAAGLLAALIILEPDFGSMSTLLMIAAAVMIASGARISHLIAVFASAIGMGWMAIQAAPYRLARILTYLNPDADRFGTGYQITQALLAIGSGGLWGLGLGQSRQKFNFLPEPIGDSVFAIMAEELGLVRVLVVILLYVAFAFFGLRIARSAPDTFGRLVATGITMWVVIQAAFNIGAMVGILPLTGIPLPFISYGGSSIIALMMGIGILLNISRQKV